MKIKIIVLVVFVGLAALIFSSHNEQVGVDQVGVRSLFGQVKVVKAGDSAVVVPWVSTFIKMTTDPVQFTMAEKEAIQVPGAAGQVRPVACTIRYQIEDAAALVARFGMGNPEVGLETLLRQKVEEAMIPAKGATPLDFEVSQERMLFTAKLLYELNSDELTPGVKILAFELLNW